MAGAQVGESYCVYIILQDNVTAMNILPVSEKKNYILFPRYKILDLQFLLWRYTNQPVLQYFLLF